MGCICKIDQHGKHCRPGRDVPVWEGALFVAIVAYLLLFLAPGVLVLLMFKVLKRAKLAALVFVGRFCKCFTFELWLALWCKLIKMYFTLVTTKQLLPSHDH